MSRKQELNWKLIGASEHINYLKREIEYVAEKIKTLDMTVLIIGESGTGKELIAKAIAEKSGKNLVPVNCGAIHMSYLKVNCLVTRKELLPEPLP